jgi:hypothetical protein
LAEEAVSSEPVSASKFPVLWENTGNFVISAPDSAYRGAQDASDSAAVESKFPKPSNREFSDGNRERLAPIREFRRPIREKPSPSIPTLIIQRPPAAMAARGFRFVSARAGNDLLALVVERGRQAAQQRLDLVRRQSDFLAAPARAPRSGRPNAIAVSASPDRDFRCSLTSAVHPGRLERRVCASLPALGCP